MESIEISLITRLKYKKILKIFSEDDANLQLAKKIYREKLIKIRNINSYKKYV